MILLLNQIILEVLNAVFQKENKKVTIINDDKIRDVTLQYGIYREAGKISALSSSKIDKYQ